jgi:hypothetical protein
MTVDLDQFYSPKEAAKALDLTTTRITQLCKDGRLEHVLTPLGRLVLRASVDDYRRGRGRG